MPAITWDKWDAGLDVRKSASTADANRLQRCTNAYVTTGYQIKKRPGLRKVATLESGTKGLRAAQGKLQTFYGTGSISHADTLFKANLVPGVLTTEAVVDVHFVDVFAGYIYASIEYDDGSVRHHYIDGTSGKLNAADKSGNLTLDASALVVSRGSASNAWSMVRGTRSRSAGRYYFEVTINALSSSGSYRPFIGVGLNSYATSRFPGQDAQSWGYYPSTTAVRYNNNVSAGYGGTLGALKTVGVEVDLDAGTITFWDDAAVTGTMVSRGTAYSNLTGNPALFPMISMYSNGGQCTANFGATAFLNLPAGATAWDINGSLVDDGNCPNSKWLAKQAQSLWGPTGEVTRYCATDAARDWTSSGDAGFLATGRQQSGTDQAVTVGDYQKNLVVFFEDGIQVWLVDPTPENIALTQRIPNVGTPFIRSHAQLYGDLVFLARSGFRSVTLAATFENMRDEDIGSPIDSLVTAALLGTEKAIGLYCPKVQQWWCVLGNYAWVYAYSKVSKVRAWCKYTFPFSIDDATVLNGETYLRSGDDVYIVDPAYFRDGNEDIDVEVAFAYQNCKAPGVTKVFQGLDVICSGTTRVSVAFDPNTPDEETDQIEYLGDHPAGTMTPLEVVAEKIAPVFRHAENEDFLLQSVTAYFESLGPM
jgi:hypothetical protein